MDCLWPSNSVSTQIARKAGRQVRAADEVLTSPIVLFAWAEAADALLDGYIKRAL